MRLTLTNREVGEYARSNQYAMMMFASASEDYFASRCCILNMLSSGFRLASEAVEKMLKAFIYLATGQKSTLRGNDRHNPYLLKQELTATHPDKTLDNFDTLLKKLHNHYQRRYFDNPTSGEGASSEELRQIDELFVYLAETMSMPDEVKYRSRFFADLCDENARRYWRNPSLGNRTQSGTPREDAIDREQLSAGIAALACCMTKQPRLLGSKAVVPRKAHRFVFISN